jgi:Protein of unknown function (DUF2851)
MKFVSRSKLSLHAANSNTNIHEYNLLYFALAWVRVMQKAHTMQEKFLSFVWRHRRFGLLDLVTTEGEPIQIISVGELNTNSGPDFSNARIEIGDTLWAGNVEIHVKSSDWIKHKHTIDKAYDSTILHVVYEEDVPITDTLGNRIACLELKLRINENLYARYMSLENAKEEILCAPFLKEIAPIIWHTWLDRLLIERLEAKTEAIAQLVTLTQGNWDQAFYIAMARSFGQKVNADPCAALAHSLPMQILAKHKPNLLQLEALLFGQAGMLEVQYKDAYPEALRKEYHFLKHKYQLQPLDAVQWKFFRLRPAAFPTIRIAQFASLVYHGSHLFSKSMEATSARGLEHLFKGEVSEYWKTHYRFDSKATKETAKPITKDLVQLMIYNTILPFWFLYGAERGKPELQQQTIQFYEEMPAEKNHIIDTWQAAGVHIKQAGQAQACIQLTNQYCTQKRCTSCAIGAQVLKSL